MNILAEAAAAVLMGESWEQVAKRVGIPSDRIGLVKRNEELRYRLNSAIRAIGSISSTNHEIFKHEDSFENCQNSLCLNSNELIKMLKAS